MLTVRQLTIETKEKKLLKDINLSLYPGEFTIILGANGAGKSTLLNSLAGGDIGISTSLKQKGNIFFCSKDLKDWHPKELAKQRAIMPQQVTLGFPFKVHEVVSMGRSPHGFDRDAKSICEHALQLMEVDHLIDRQYPSLSGGEQQRVQLARVLSQIWQDNEEHDTKYLLLDECTSALDPAHQHHVLEVIKHFTVNNVISCAITHDLHLGSQYADRILLLKDGQLIADGSPKEVMTQAKDRKSVV